MAGKVDVNAAEAWCGGEYGLEVERLDVAVEFPAVDGEEGSAGADFEE